MIGWQRPVCLGGVLSVLGAHYVNHIGQRAGRQGGKVNYYPHLGVYIVHKVRQQASWWGQMSVLISYVLSQGKEDM